jgi:hypothetical protein
MSSQNIPLKDRQILGDSNRIPAAETIGGGDQSLVNSAPRCFRLVELIAEAAIRAL